MATHNYVQVLLTLPLKWQIQCMFLERKVKGEMLKHIFFLVKVSHSAGDTAMLKGTVSGTPRTMRELKHSKKEENI